MTGVFGRLRLGLPGYSPSTPTPGPTPTPAPVFTVQPSISHDGTPQVSETLTGHDGTTTNGSVSARQWLLGGSAISGATGATYVPTATGSHTYRVTATGAGGSTQATSAAVTVTAASPSYTLPTLSIAPVAAWSPYRIRSGHSGACSQITRGSDNATLDVPTLSDGSPDMAATATFHGGQDPLYRRVYGQVGSEGYLEAHNDWPRFTAGHSVRGRYPVVMTSAAALRNDTLTGSNLAVTVINIYGRRTSASGGNAVEVALHNVSKDDAGAIALETTGYQQLVLVGGPTRYKGTNAIGRSQLVMEGLRCSATNVEVLLDDRVHSLGYVDAAATWTGITVGQVATDPQNFPTDAKDWLATVVYPGALTNGDLTALRAWAASAFDVLPTASAAGQFILPGNSITAGYGADYQRGWAHRLDLALSQRLIFKNMGIFNLSGANMYGQISRWTGAYDGALPKNLLLSPSMTNDLGAGTTGANAWNNTVAPFIQAGVAAGFVVLAPTDIKRTDWTTAKENERLAFNALVRANAAGLGATVLDFASLDASVSVPDGVHPDSATAQAMADYAIPIVEGLL